MISQLSSLLVISAISTSTFDTGTDFFNVHQIESIAFFANFVTIVSTPVAFTALLASFHNKGIPASATAPIPASATSAFHSFHNEYLTHSAPHTIALSTNHLIDAAGADAFGHQATDKPTSATNSPAFVANVSGLTHIAFCTHV